MGGKTKASTTRLNSTTFCKVGWVSVLKKEDLSEQQGIRERLF